MINIIIFHSILKTKAHTAGASRVMSIDWNGVYNQYVHMYWISQLFDY